MDFRFEKKLWEQGYKFIAGVDEAGRGPLAGPVVAAAVILQSSGISCESMVKEIKDSKKLTPKKRELLFGEIKKYATGVGIGVATWKEIDKINILQATLLAMRRAIQNLERKPDYIIVDGRDKPFHSNLRRDATFIPQRAIVRGDTFCPSIAAASIIAKVTRDKLMKEFALQYPRYKFEKHKGYPTRKHISILKKLGPCPIHRRSFRPVRLI